jgi:hypothetical protein
VPVPIARPRSACASAGRVVDAVADHRDDAALVLQPLDDADLVGRQHVGDDLVDADLGGHCSRRRLVVAGEQHRAQAEGAQPPDGQALVGLTVSATTSARRTCRPTRRRRRYGRRRGIVDGGLQRGRRAQRPVGEQLRPTGDHGVTVDHALHAEAPLAVLERLDRRQLAHPLAGGGGDGPRDGVLAGVLERTDQAAAPRPRRRRRSTPTAGSSGRW